MAFDSMQGGGPRPFRQMNNVAHLNLKCADCGQAITELPFMPDPTRAVWCSNCNANRRKSFRGPRP